MNSNKKIFPASILEQTSEFKIYELSRSSKAIYLIILFTIISFLVALFFIRINVTVKAGAQIKPIGEKITLASPVSGRIHFVNIQENKRIHSGDTLAVILSQRILAQIPPLETRKSDLLQFMDDLNILLKDIQVENLTLASSQYAAKHRYFISQLNQLLIKKSAIETNYQRNLILYKEKVIALADFEKIKTEYDQSVGEVATHLREYTHQLESDRIVYQKEIREISAQINQIKLQNEETVILASVSGSISKIYGISDNAYLQAGQQILEISPDGELMAECILPSKDIGYIVKGQAVRIQIDAFNYNEWGMLSGKVIDIYNDIVISEDQKMAYFKVYCSLDSNKLYLKNGFSGEVRKGMPAFVLFIVTQRTLANLLYDKLDNWLNPNVKPI